MSVSCFASAQSVPGCGFHQAISLIDSSISINSIKVPFQRECSIVPVNSGHSKIEKFIMEITARGPHRLSFWAPLSTSAKDHNHDDHLLPQPPYRYDQRSPSIPHERRSHQRSTRYRLPRKSQSLQTFSVRADPNSVASQERIKRDNVQGAESRAVMETVTEEKLMDIARGFDEMRANGVRLRSDQAGDGTDPLRLECPR